MEFLGTDITLIKSVLEAVKGSTIYEMIFILILFFNKSIIEYSKKFYNYIISKFNKTNIKKGHHVENMITINIKIHKVIDLLQRELGCDRVGILEYSNGIDNPSEWNKIKMTLYRETLRSDEIISLYPFIQKLEIINVDDLTKIKNAIEESSYHFEVKNIKNSQLKNVFDVTETNSWYVVRIGSKEYNSRAYFVSCFDSREAFFKNNKIEHNVKLASLKLVELFELLQNEY
jgi:hypothetical protein